MLDGGTPYVDAANNKGPLTYGLFALLELVGGSHPVVHRAVLIVFAGLAALAVAGYTAHYAGRAAGAFAGVTFALLSGTPVLQGDDLNTEQFGVAPMAGAWYLATRGSSRSRGRAAGALTAAAILMNIAFAVVAPFVAWELWRAAPAGRRARPLLIAAAGARSGAADRAVARRGRRARRLRRPGARARPGPPRRAAPCRAPAELGVGGREVEGLHFLLAVPPAASGSPGCSAPRSPPRTRGCARRRWPRCCGSCSRGCA